MTLFLARRSCDVNASRLDALIVANALLVSTQLAARFCAGRAPTLDKVTTLARGNNEFDQN